MQLLRILLITLFVFSTQGKPHSSCDCGLSSGENVCGGKKCVPLVVRPHEVPKPLLRKPIKICAEVGGVPPMNPIGGPCTCTRAIVRPAHLSKPVCTHSTSECQSECQQSSHHQQQASASGGLAALLSGAGGSAGGLASLLKGSGIDISSLLGGAGIDISSLLGGASGPGALASLLGGASGPGGLTSLLGGASGPGGLASLLGGASGAGGSGGLSSLLSGAGGSNGLASLLGGAGASGIDLSSILGGPDVDKLSRLSSILGVVGGITSTLNGDNQEPDETASTLNPAQYVPADPVSLAIAYRKAQQAFTHREDQLAFGFRKMPKEVPQTRRRTNNIPEENLYGINGQIVELKPIVYTTGKSIDEEAAEDLLELAQEELEENAQEASNVKHLTLGEVGYGPAKAGKPVPFINVPVANPIMLLEEGLVKGLESKLLCTDGHAPGSVSLNHVTKPEHFDLPRPLPEPCDSSEDSNDAPLPVLPLFQSSSSSSSSSSCSSSARHHKCSSILQPYPFA